ncbi:protein atonal homolog 7-b [Plakobranchus ocellatus]|uniref:Protein atonal homolog 7-b n=1 Tax=Plakobranchus ocellatus TaxID=259542 RepID=A0AAV4DIF6_9GAST|nr:protein atonal homolog 7-b [Plakobranchus ocellatus]
MYGEKVTSLYYSKSTKATLTGIPHSDKMEQRCSSPLLASSSSSTTSSTLSPKLPATATGKAAATTTTSVTTYGLRKRKSCAKKHEGLNEEEIEKKRLRNNELERIRQQALQSAFRSLGEVVPEDMASSRHKPSSKIYTLENAMNYIRNLARLVAYHDLQLFGRTDPRYLMLANFSPGRDSSDHGSFDDIDIYGKYSGSEYHNGQVNYENHFLGDNVPYFSPSFWTRNASRTSFFHDSGISDKNDMSESFKASGQTQRRQTPPNFLEEGYITNQKQDVITIPEKQSVPIQGTNVPAHQISLSKTRFGKQQLHQSYDHSTPLSQLHPRKDPCLSDVTPILPPGVSSIDNCHEFCTQNPSDSGLGLTLNSSHDISSVSIGIDTASKSGDLHGSSLSSFSPERLGLTLREIVDSTPLHRSQATTHRRKIDFDSYK